MNHDFNDSSNPYAAPRESTLPPISTAGPHAPCPRCSSRNARKVSYTWWGGVLGPKLFNHVKCNQCGAGYNGKSGKSNAMPIFIYTLVVTLIAIVVALAIWS